MSVCIISYHSEEYFASVALREKILRKPLGLEFTDSELLKDKSDFQIAYFENNVIVGILLLKPIDGKVIKMRQLAVDVLFQKKGVGRELVIFSEGFCRTKNYQKIILHARNNAIPFYEKLNYRKIGKKFTEVGILHHLMEKNLQ